MLLSATLDAIVVERPVPTDEAPQDLCLDKGYDNRKAREMLAQPGYVAHVRRIGRRRSKRQARSGIRPGVGWWSER